MALNQTTLRGILAQILSVNQKYVVPKQGNWWNPQEANANIENWCAYRIKSNQPTTAPFYHKGNLNGSPVNAVVVQKIAEVELQFVGPQSEDLAASISMWPLRSDVRTALASIHGAIMYEPATAMSSAFAQEGNNTVTAWNVSVKILWYDIMDTNQNVISTIELGGQTNVTV